MAASHHGRLDGRKGNEKSSRTSLLLRCSKVFPSNKANCASRSSWRRTDWIRKQPEEALYRPPPWREEG